MRETDFPILQTKVHNRRLIYLDNAATSQKPQRVLDAIQYAYTHFNANIHRGVHHLSQEATRHHEESRLKVAQFLHARSEKEIIFTKGTTDSINMLARSLSDQGLTAEDEIIVSQMEHHSNIVPWQMLCQRTGARLRVIPLLNDLRLDMEAYKALLCDRTRLVAVAHVSNVLGIENPIRDIIDLAHSVGAKVMIDAAQSAPHIKLDVQALDCDFLVLSAHKMYGPTGLGILYGKQQWLETLPPAEGGGEMIDHVTFEKTTYNQLPYKFEAGTPNFIGSWTFAEALRYIEEIGQETLEHHESDLIAYAEERLLGLGAIVYAAGQTKHGALSFNFQGIHPYDLGMLLDQQGVAIRTGHHCAEPLIDHLGVPGTARLSVAIYNTKDDIDTFLKALSIALEMLR